MAPQPYLREISLKADKIIPYSEFPFIIPAVKHLGRLAFDPHVTFLVGENGTGKSTLLEAIAVALGFNAEGGGRNFNFSTRSSHSQLYLRLVRSYQRPRDSYFLRAESLFNVATEIERLDGDAAGGSPIIDAYGGRSLHQQSHGESFFALMTHRFRGRGLYILDEPEAALSPKRQLMMLRRMRQLVQQDSQFIIATHSPILLAYPNARILVLNEQGYTATPYEETEHYRTTKAFLSDPQTCVTRLFAEENPSQNRKCEDVQK
jgi:predicted ATPase